MPESHTKRSDRLMKLLGPFDEVVVVTHDNPDPDAIASGWTIYFLVERLLSKPVRLVAGGAVVRAENLRMLELLHPPLELVHRVTAEKDCAVVLIDCHPEATNHLLSGTNLKPLAVIDHHLAEKRPAGIRFRDIRPRVTASATIAGVYLREQSIEPSMELATALLYAIRSETHGRGITYTKTDRQIASWLTERADHTKLADIENALLTRSYFADLLVALENCFIYDDSALCFLPRASGPETVGEIADLLIRCSGVRHVLCAALIQNDLLLSTRTTPDGGDAVVLLSQTIRGLGYCGGHPHRAGGKITKLGNKKRALEDVQSTIRSRWLAACGVEANHGIRLVPKQEILEHLKHSS
ncbi:MAG: DHH family phosphoesterase [Planctomycetota bacterium]|jgi:nanoRNase/pAp phosphatase (c-di-AMP/oligoRNAs hydrolase)